MDYQILDRHLPIPEKMQGGFQQNVQLQVDQYCWCPENTLQAPQYASEGLCGQLQMSSPTLASTTKSSSAGPAPAVKERRRKADLPHLDVVFHKILQAHQDGQHLVFTAQEKTTRGLHRGRSERRSQYIGVLKNKGRWQALINVGKLKRYIGTFHTENQAALAHDMYSIGMHFKQAKINFSYTAEDMVPMIQSYLADNRHFDPAKFI